MTALAGFDELTDEQILERLLEQPPEARLAFQEHISRGQQRVAASKHPGLLLRHVRCIDTESGEEFEFCMEDAESGWFFQRDLLDWWLEQPKTLILKARQLGITWLAAGLMLWHLLYRPGTRCLVISFNEKEAIKVVNRVWVMLQSLPAHLLNGVEVVKPARGADPSTVIEVRHRDGKKSTVLGLPSTQSAGRGETAAVVVLDELAFHEYAADTYAAVLPTAAKGGRIIGISTANGVSNLETGEGNHFHLLWKTAEDTGVATRFLGWRTHPDRDDDFYRREVMAIPDAIRRAREYPADPDEAFMLSAGLYFDADALNWYRGHAVKAPVMRGSFVTPSKPDRGVFEKQDLGWVRVYDPPHPDHSYAIGADVATGHGKDYSCAFVIDLQTMGLCAEIHAKVGADVYAKQLHFLGKWYGTARIAVEDAGGWGEAVTVFLRDAKDGRPPYPNLYRHRQFSRGDIPEGKGWGFPVNSRTRPEIVVYMARTIREKALPWMPEGLVSECSTFVHRETGTSPAAQDGCNDDRVMACAVAVEMYRQYGHHPDAFKRPKPAREYVPQYPWQRTAA